MERHDLLHEFPEYHDKIHQLKQMTVILKKYLTNTELEHQFIVLIQMLRL
jgi:hypothetical protein